MRARSAASRRKRARRASCSSESSTISREPTMRKTVTGLFVVACAALVSVTLSAQRGGGGGGGRGAAADAPAPSGPNYPAWAYAITPPPPPGTPRPPAPPVDNSVHHIAGTDRGFTVAQIADIRGPADWFPEDHPQMPPIVAVG